MNKLMTLLAAAAAISLAATNIPTALGHPAPSITGATWTHEKVSDEQDDQQLLVGVLFAIGEYAEQTGVDVREFGQPIPPNYEAVASRVVGEYYEERNDDASLAVDRLRSGDLLTAREGLQGLLESFQPWVRNELAAGNVDLQASGIAGPQAAACVWNVCAVNLALFLNVAVAVNIYLAAFVIDDNQSRSSRAAGEADFLVRLSDAASRES